MIAAGLAAGISNGPKQAYLLINLGNEPDTSIAGDVTATVIGFDTLVFNIFPLFYYPLREIFGLAHVDPYCVSLGPRLPSFAPLCRRKFVQRSLSYYSATSEPKYMRKLRHVIPNFVLL